MKYLVIILAFVTITIMSGQITSAHVTVKPSDVLAGSYQTFTTSVPNEKDVPVSSVRLVIPHSVRSVTPTVKTGWKIDTKKSAGAVTEISWSGGTIPAELRDEFTFSAQAPDDPGEIAWKAYQTYADGTVVAWDQAPATAHGHDESDETAGPYSVTEVSNIKPTDNTGNQNVLLYVLSIAAALLSLVAIVHSIKRY